MKYHRTLSKPHSALILTTLSLLALVLICPALHATPTYDLPPARYSEAVDHNGVTALREKLPELRKIKGGLANLKYILRTLHVPISSQMLVFSKTSEQNELISPRNPRALYFSEDFYVGYVPGGRIEIIAADDPTGVMFYMYDPRIPAKNRHITRELSCLRCHATARTHDVPGMLVRSVHADQQGHLASRWGSHTTTPMSPLSERWGGWYVTGSHGDTQHMGNKITKKQPDNTYTYHPEHGQNISSLKNYVDLSDYLTDTSDIVALMIMEHQIHMQNTFSAARFSYNRAHFLYQSLHKKDPAPQPSSQLLKLIDRQSDLILAGLLFSNHTRLPADGVDGSASFQNDFKEAATKSTEGWSLRDLRLQKRLFKYRCSYTIHSKAFAAIPAPIRHSVLKKLHQHLTSTPLPHLPTLSSRETSRIHAILSQTLPGYPR